MEYRRLGRTNILVSVVGFGTCQLRLVPERQAIETLCHGFDLGVNLVHTAPDYEGAEDLVARAVRASGQDVIVCSQGYGSMELFEWHFESTCRRLGKDRLEMFGIACVDDREKYGENVWGPGGMVEFLERKKREGRLIGSFCTTHGPPEYIRGLLERDAFDAIMMSYNPLGFHLLTYNPPPGWPFEASSRNHDLWPAARERDVGIMVMKPLAGGLLCPSRAFPPRAELRPAGAAVTATDVLRSILGHAEVSCVVAGTSSIAEADENARAGEQPFLAADRQGVLAQRMGELQSSVCSRCGKCEELCSQKLPVSWLFRGAYISLYPSETFETPPEHEYFRLHPSLTSTCATCPDVTCSCPAAIDIPASLMRVHAHMVELMHDGRVPAPGADLTARQPEDLAGTVVIRSIPSRVSASERSTCGLQAFNAGRQPWLKGESARPFPRVALEVEIDGHRPQVVPLREDVYPGFRGHFSFELEAPPPGERQLTVRLVQYESEDLHRSITLHEGLLRVD